MRFGYKDQQINARDGCIKHINTLCEQIQSLLVLKAVVCIGDSYI
jgi:hypothetical protein